MNHQKVYDNIIEKAKSENRIKHNGAYYENHHINPRCLGGNDNKENLVLLTAKEHYLCHKLLTYIYKGNNKIANAFHRMTFDKHGKHNISSRDYVYAKWLRSNIPQKSHYDTWLEKYGEEEAKKRHKEKKEKIKKTMTGVKYSKERREKSALGHIGLKQSKETCEKRSKSLSGENHPMYGKHLSEKTKQKISKNNGSRRPEIREKISKSCLGKKLSEETKEKIKNTPKKECKYCNKIIAPSVFSRCHGEKCKFKT